jgi:hypothetical protein
MPKVNQASKSRTRSAPTTTTDTPSVSGGIAAMVGP